MDRKKRLIKLSIIIFMVFTMTLKPIRTLAYWSNSIPNNKSVQLSSNVKVGYWNQIFSWNSTTTYSIGNRVVYNGITYEAKKDNINVIPGVSPGWKSSWNAI